MNLRGKTVVLGISGGIAAYKSASLASSLVKLGAEVHVVMTKNAANFINPFTFETLTKKKCLIDTFDRNFEYDVKHISLAKKADIFMIAPATANVIGKLAHGICDDMLTTVAMAYKGPVYVVPAMNTDMYDNPVMQDNLKILRGYGKQIIEPASGRLACGDTGKGKMPEPEELLEYILLEISHEKDLAGKKILVTAGPTREAIDPVRFITNHSTGKMGYAVARQAARRGADVVLVSGPCDIKAPLGVNTAYALSAKEMYDNVVQRAPESDIIVMAAAVADYRPMAASSEKIKKKDGETSLLLERTDDILAYLGGHKKPGQFLCGFSMETENVIENSRAKLAKKNADMICANSLRQEGAGFGTDTNILTLITADGETNLPVMSKEDAADEILSKILRLS